jgi:hypothetical protein
LQLKLESSSTMLFTARSTTQRATLRVLPRSMWLARRPHKILQIADTEPGPKRSTPVGRIPAAACKGCACGLKAFRPKIGRLYLSGTDPQIDKALDEALAQGRFQVIALNQAFKAKWDQAETATVAAAGAWISDRKYFGKSDVAPGPRQ